MHAGGEKIRIIEAGFPELKGTTLLEKRKWLMESADQYRKFLLLEPRGQPSLTCALLVKPDSPEVSDVGVIFFDKDMYGAACGTAVLCVSRYAVEKKLVQPASPETRVVIQCPSGLVTTHVQYHNGRTGQSRFQNVPSYVFARDVSVNVPGLGEVMTDIAFGGGFYAIVPAHRLGISLTESSTDAILDIAQAFLGRTDNDAKDTCNDPCVELGVFGKRQVQKLQWCTSQVMDGIHRGLEGCGNFFFTVHDDGDEDDEMHAAGGKIRIIEAGFPELKGTTLLEKRKWLKESADQYRKFLVLEPRGQPSLTCALLVKPDSPEVSDVGVIFFDKDMYCAACGTAMLCVSRYAVEKKLVQPVSPETRVVIQCPSGLVTTHVQYHNGRTGQSRFQNVPSYVFARDVSVNVPGLGEVMTDIAFGGSFYAIVPAHRLGISLTDSSTDAILDIAQAFLGRTDNDAKDTCNDPCVELGVFGKRQVQKPAG
nr:hypothetical protein BaRGS_001310 [Batillaria attramentaria]